MSANSRRGFLKTASLAGLASATSPYWFAPSSMAAPFRSANDRPVLGCIGTGDQWNAVGPSAMKFADCAAVCDVDVANVEKSKKPGNHMKNRFECIVDRTQPISDVHSHHRAMTVCHLANIVMRLDRTIQWDPEKEQIVGDPDAAQWHAREQRKGFEIQV